MRIFRERSIKVAAGLSLATALTFGWVLLSDAWTDRAAARPGPKVTKEMVDAWMTELSNWGRWGKDDQLGTINLITPEKRKQAAALVKKGISVSLARDTEKEKGAR